MHPIIGSTTSGIYKHLIFCIVVEYEKLYLPLRWLFPFVETQESPSSVLLVWVHHVQHEELKELHLLSPAVAAYSQKAWSKCLLFSVSGIRESAWRCHRWQGRSSGVIVGKLICKHSSENLFPSVKCCFGTYLHETKMPSIKCHLVHQPNCLQASYSTK